MCKDLNLFARNILRAINYGANTFIQGWKVTYYFIMPLFSIINLIFFDNYRYFFICNNNSDVITFLQEQ